AQRLNALYARLPEEQRPTVLPLDDVGKLTIVGDETAINEGMQVLREIDGLDEVAIESGRRMQVITLEHAEPAGLIAAMQTLLNGRQLVATKLVAGPDNQSIIVSGPAADVAAVERVIAVLDRPQRIDREVRLLRLRGDGAARTLRLARDLYGQETAGGDPGMALSTELDEATGLVTVMGSRAAQERFAAMLRMVETNVVIDRETRQIELTSATPSRITGSLASLARQLLRPRDGETFRAPELDAVDALDLLVVTATPDQFPVIESLVRTLDRPDPSEYRFRVVSLAGVEDVDALLERTDGAWTMMTRGFGPDEMPKPVVEVDSIGGNIIVSGRNEAVGLYEQSLAEARRLMPPARTGRMYPLRQARAEEVLTALNELLAKSAPVDPGRTVMPPSIEVVERTNSLYVIAEPAQHQVLDRYVRELDTFEPTEMPPMRLLQVRAADAVQLSTLLRQRYDARPAEQRREQPVDLSADAGTNTLIVIAHEEVFTEVKQFVDEVNRAGDLTAERETMIFPLRRARAIDLAQALDKLYPQPPMPMDRRGRPMPHLQEPKEVHVSADAATNTLIVEAPVERRASFETLVEQLDRVELPPLAELRTYAIDRGDPAKIAATLNDLARQGVLSRQPEDGSKPVDVIVQFEPQSRTLIVAGDDVTFEKTESILSDLQAVPVPRRLQVFEVIGADPRELADRALALYSEQTAEVPGAGEVSVEVDGDNAARLVVADDEALIQFASILNQLQEAIGPPPDVRLIPLQYADAADVVGFLDDLVASAAMLNSRIGPPPMFEVIERTNSLLVAAQADQHQIIRSLVESLDVVQDQEMPPLRILQLRTADAGNLAGALMREYGRRPVEERNTKPVSITADPGTNSLIVAAHPDMLPEIEGIARELNDTLRMDTEGREIRIFPLKVARAEELARTIDEMFPEPPIPVDRRGRPVPGLQEPREVVVRADPQTNSLIV
ncbi:MAG: secretin N-terminal domain-containing protein, partial [Planctomycetota bacterium]